MSNPALNEKVLTKIRDTSRLSGDVSRMTLEGTINRAGLLILLTIAGGILGWSTQSTVLLIGSLILSLIMVFLIVFKPERAPSLSPVYAVSEGILLGSISALYSRQYPGIVSNAMILTMSCLMIMLGLYKFKIIKVTEKFRSVLMAAMFAIMITYLINMVMGFFGTNIPMIHEGSTAGIFFSVVVVGVAAFSLLLDFDMIEQAYTQGSPKYMEWYGGFALLVTLVWLYLEILQLLNKLNRK